MQAQLEAMVRFFWSFCEVQDVMSPHSHSLSHSHSHSLVLTEVKVTAYASLCVQVLTRIMFFTWSRDGPRNQPPLGEQWRNTVFLQSINWLAFLANCVVKALMSALSPHAQV
jgi:hypothetical protein